jgi:hypothetical protein
MSSLLWLGGALAAGVAAYVIGSPALTATRIRGARDLNEERYLAWRGRATKPSASARRGMTPPERRRLWIAAGMAALAGVCLVAFFVAS